MSYQLQLLLFLFILTSRTHGKSVIEPCNNSDSCTSLLSYLLPYDSKLSEISNRFQVTISNILSANSINATTTSLGNQIFRAKSLVKVPISCPCVDGIRRSMSTVYTVRPADTVDSISQGFGGLVGTEQIKSINGVSATNPLTSGQSLVISLPCACFNNSDNGVPSVYMSYVVQTGDSLGSVAAAFGSTVAELEAINGLGQPVVHPGDILALPIPACSSAHLNWYNESLLVPNGSYALTATNCIKCNCGPNDLNLRCGISGIGVSCSNIQCKGSDLFIGDAYVKPSTSGPGCNITACVYRGHNGGKIFRSLLNSSFVPCPGNYPSHYNYGVVPPCASPSSNNPTVPYITLSPSPSPSPSPLQFSSPNTPIINNSYHITKQNSNVSSCGKILCSKTLSLFIFSLELVLYLICCHLINCSFLFIN